MAPRKTRDVLAGAASALAALVGLLLLIFAVEAARAHGDAQWIADDPTTDHCCGVDDCAWAPNPTTTVTEAGPGRWHVRVTTHPNAPLGTERTFEEGGPDVFPSIDQHYWVCVYHGRVRCFFYPPAGV